MNKPKQIKTVLSIAGTDPSGGAGIQADIKAISATGSYAASVITALVAQNTTGVQGIHAVPVGFVKQQLDSVCTDLTIHAVKLGMLHTANIMQDVVDALEHYQLPHVVLDPVMVAKNGSPLLDASLITCLKKTLFSHATLLTPNVPEAEKITGTSIKTTQHMRDAARSISQQYNTHVLLKGGHLDASHAHDVLCTTSGETTWFESPRIITHNTHGTGCTLSSAIASFLAQGKSMVDAIHHAKNYLYHAIASGSKQSMGQGHGPVDHFYFLDSCDTPDTTRETLAWQSTEAP
jgi:hydroxymethylpyrimidine/phosphomethylpyrimidine kinase